MGLEEQTAIYVGSFDPPTLGHLWVIQEGGETVQHLRVAIGTNPNKECAYLVGQRLEWLNEITRGSRFQNVVVNRQNNDAWIPMLYETFVRAIERVKDSLVKNPNFDDDNPKVVIVLMEGKNEKFEQKVLGEIGCVITLDDGRIGLVPSKK